MATSMDIPRIGVTKRRRRRTILLAVVVAAVLIWIRTSVIVRKPIPRVFPVQFGMTKMRMESSAVKSALKA